MKIIETKKKWVEDQIIATLFNKGNVKDVMFCIWKIKKWARVNDAERVGPPFAIYYTNPKIVGFENMVYVVGIPINNIVESDNKVKIKEVSSHKVLYTTHKGPYEKIEPIYKALFDVVNKKKYELTKPPKEIYFNHLPKVLPKKLLTEVQFGIKNSKIKS